MYEEIYQVTTDVISLCAMANVYTEKVFKLDSKVNYTIPEFSLLGKSLWWGNLCKIEWDIFCFVLTYQVLITYM